MENTSVAINPATKTADLFRAIAHALKAKYPFGYVGPSIHFFFEIDQSNEWSDPLYFLSSWALKSESKINC